MFAKYRRIPAAAGLMAALAITGGAAFAAPGDWMVRVGPALVGPNDDSGALSGADAPGDARVAVDDSVSLGITLTWMATDNIGIGVLGAWPFKHDIKGAGALGGAGKIAEVRHLPPTVTLQYHLNPGASLRPYIGAGLNYTTFFSEKTTGAIADFDIDFDDSFGWALEAGVDYDLGPDWFLSAQLWYVAIDTKAKLSGPADLGEVSVDIDPWVVMIGAGRRF